MFLLKFSIRTQTKGAAALQRIEEAGEDISLTSLNLHEILFGIYKYADKQKSRE